MGQEAGRTWWELLPLPAPKALVWFILEFLRNFLCPSHPVLRPEQPPPSPGTAGNSPPPFLGALGKQELVFLSLSPSCTPSNPPAPSGQTPAPTSCRVWERSVGGCKTKLDLLVIAFPTFHGSRSIRTVRGEGGEEHQNLCTRASRSLRRSSSL